MIAPTTAVVPSASTLSLLNCRLDYVPSFSYGCGLDLADTLSADA
jgi:hypothetical protein